MRVEVEPARQGDDAFVEQLATAERLNVDPARERQLAQSELLVARAEVDQELARGEAEKGGTSSAPPDTSRPVGFVLFWLLPDDMEIHDVAVDRAYRRRGVAKRLLQAALLLAQEQGKCQAFLEVHSENTAAIALYRALGFTEFDRRRRYYPDGKDALLFRSCLGAGT